MSDRVNPVHDEITRSIFRRDCSRVNYRELGAPAASSKSLRGARSRHQQSESPSTSTVRSGAACATNPYLPSTPFPSRCIGIKNTGLPWPSPSTPMPPPPPLPLPLPWLEPVPQDRRRLSRSGRRAGRSAGQTSSKASMCYKKIAKTARGAKRCMLEPEVAASRSKVPYRPLSFSCWNNNVTYLLGYQTPHPRPLSPICHALHHLVKYSNPSRPIERNSGAFDHFRGKPNHSPASRCSPRCPPVCRRPSWCFHGASVAATTAAVQDTNDPPLPSGRRCSGAASRCVCPTGDRRYPGPRFRGRVLRVASPGKPKVVESGPNSMRSCASPFVWAGSVSSRRRWKRPAFRPSRSDGRCGG